MFCLICNAMVLLSLTSVRAADSSPDGTTVDRITFREENRFDPVVYVDGAEVKEGMQGLNPDSVFIGAYFVSRGYFVCHLAVRS